MLVGVNQKITPIKFGFLIKPNSKNNLKIITETAFFFMEWHSFTNYTNL